MSCQFSLSPGLLLPSEMLVSFIVLLVGVACLVCCRNLKERADGHTWNVKDLLKEQRNGITDDSESEILEGKLLAESMYLAVKMSEIRKKTALPAVYSTEVCYEDLGCFSSIGKMRHVDELPEHPDVIKTSFALYSNTSSEHPIYLNYRELNQTSVSQHFTTAKDIVLIIHGFVVNGQCRWIMNITKKLIEKKDRIVIVVDWSAGARFPYYNTAVANSALVGRQVSLLLQRLMALYPEAVHPEMVHLIGFSLGAHVTGFCGRHFHGETNQTLGRITALDAAGPLFENTAIHVSRDDALYVDAIHTSGGGAILLGQFGIEKPIGHADFYPNGGRSQPGCSLFNIGCSHDRAVKYFVESLLVHTTRCRFKSYPCNDGIDGFVRGDCGTKNSSGEMGFPSYFVDTRGEQFLRTRSRPPFCVES